MDHRAADPDILAVKGESADPREGFCVLDFLIAENEILLKCQWEGLQSKEEDEQTRKKREIDSGEI